MNATAIRGTIAGFEAIFLENRCLRVCLIPHLGGRVWELTDRVRDRQWIWHREDVALAPCPPGSSYDDNWAGGWEELFPNDAPGTFEGRTLFDHGEWWTASWAVSHFSSGARATVRLVPEASVRGAHCTKEYCLAGDGNHLRVSYRIENHGAQPFHFLFKQHLPIAITSSCVLALPGGQVTAVDPAFGTVLPSPGPFAWPMAGAVDLRVVPERSRTAREFVYVTEMPESWCGVDDLEKGASLRMHYDQHQVPFLWLFLSYGGWRDCYTAVLDPCTNMPKDLAEAVRVGQSARLAPGSAFKTSVTVTLSGLRLIA
jgi:hypothetical protein